MATTRRKPGPPKGSRYGGRKKGTPNKSTTEVGQFFRQILESKTYQANLTKRFKAGKVAPALETLAFHYVYGKPKEQHELSGSVETVTRIVHEHQS
jgi:hypothetical protein